jgi:hypothetical protein
MNVTQIALISTDDTPTVIGIKKLLPALRAAKIRVLTQVRILTSDITARNFRSQYIQLYLSKARYIVGISQIGAMTYFYSGAYDIRLSDTPVGVPERFTLVNESYVWMNNYGPCCTIINKTEIIKNPSVLCNMNYIIRKYIE